LMEVDNILLIVQSMKNFGPVPQASPKTHIKYYCCKLILLCHQLFILKGQLPPSRGRHLSLIK
jgi:hypothetical protein